MHRHSYRSKCLLDYRRLYDHHSKSNLCYTDNNNYNGKKTLADTRLLPRSRSTRQTTFPYPLPSQRSTQNQTFKTIFPALPFLCSTTSTCAWSACSSGNSRPTTGRNHPVSCPAAKKACISFQSA